MTMPNNFVLGSDKLFGTKAPWKLNDSLLGQLKNDHYIHTFSTQDNNFVKEGQRIHRGIRKTLKDNVFEHKVFIGYGKDCVFASALYLQYGIEFDTIFLVNNLNSPQVYEPVIKFAALYNIYTKPGLSNKIVPWAECNQYIRTTQPAYMSNRVALEITGLLMYDRYNVDYFTNNQSILTEI